jgi:hypothetical protein
VIAVLPFFASRLRSGFWRQFSERIFEPSKKFAPAEKVRVCRKSSRLQKKFAPAEKVRACRKSSRLQKKFAPAEKVRV